MGSIIGDLDITTITRLCHSISHRIRDLATCRVHDHVSIHITSRSTDDLEQGSLGSQESDLLSIEYPDEARLGEIEPFSEEIDSHDDIDISEAIFTEDLESFEGLDLTMEISDLESILSKIGREIFGGFLRNRRDK